MTHAKKRGGFTGRQKLRRGFSLIEMMIVIAIFVVVSAAVIPMLSISTSRQSTASLTVDLVQALRRAQTRSISGTLGKTWGITVMQERDGYVLFAGNSYVQKAQNIPEEIHPLQPPFEVCMGDSKGTRTEIVFPAIVNTENESVYFELYSIEADADEESQFVVVDTTGTISVAKEHVLSCR